MYVYAKWTYHTYDINYELNGGVWVDPEYEAPSGITYAGGDIDLPTSRDISRYDYNFLGWYDNNNFTGDVYTYVSEYTDRDITLYAKWEKIIHPKAGGGGGGGGAIPRGMGENIVPGTIINDTDLPSSIAYVAMNTLGEYGMHVVRSNKIVREAIINYPPNMLAVRDIQTIIRSDMSEKDIMSLIERKMREYPVTITYTWDTRYKIHIQKYTVYDWQTKMDYEVNMSILRSQWLGRYDRGKIYWCYYDNNGFRLKNLYQNGNICYLFDQNGIMLTGYQIVNGVLLYFDETVGPGEGQLTIPNGTEAMLSNFSNQNLMGFINTFGGLR